MRRAFTDRNTYLGDPAFVQNPTDRLLSQGLRRRSPEGDRRAGLADARVRRRRPARGASTTHYSVVDAEGNAVSCTTTLNDSYGSAVTVTGGGLPAERRDGRLRHGTGQAEHVRPGAGRGQRDRAGQAHALGDDAEHRARSRQDGCYLVVGTPGGPAHHHHGVPRDLQRDRPPDAAARRGRAPRACTTRACPTRLQVERGGFLPATLDSLRARGHAHRRPAATGATSRRSSGRRRAGRA